MNYMLNLVNFILHIDLHLSEFLRNFDPRLYPFCSRYWQDTVQKSGKYNVADGFFMNHIIPFCRYPFGNIPGVKK
jgi:hypothetical protein